MASLSNLRNVLFEDNSAEIKKLFARATDSALEIMGQKIETWAKGLCSPKGPNGNMLPGAPELRNSISHSVRNGVLTVGSEMQIAPYVELGTGKEYVPPPEWLEYHGTDKHSKSGVDWWIFFDPNEKVFKIGKPIKAQPYLRPAIMDHVEELRAVVEGELKKTQT